MRLGDRWGSSIQQGLWYPAVRKTAGNAITKIDGAHDQVVGARSNGVFTAFLGYWDFEVEAC